MIMKNKILIGFASLSLLATSGCGLFQKDKGGSSGDSAVEDAENPGEETQDVVKDEVSADAQTLETGSVKVRSYQQFYATYALLLGIPADNQTFLNSFNDVSANLPTTSSSLKFSGSHQLAAMKLASSGCDIVYNTSSLEEKAQMFGIDFSSNQPVGVFSSGNRLTLSKTLISKFWNRDIDSLADTDLDVLEISSLVEASLAALLADDPNTADDVLIRASTVAACSAVLASAPVSFY